MIEDLKMTDNTEAEVSGFNSIDAIRYVGFNDRFISTFEEILTNFSNMQRTQDIINFTSKLRQHINNNNAHDLQLDDVSSTLIDQLYEMYRQYGYTGTTGDMLDALLKQVDIGTLEEVILGVSQTKAITAPCWQVLADRHNANVRSHKHIFETLQPGDAFNVTPQLFLNYYLRQIDETFRGDTVTLSEWNPHEGTIYFKFGYNYTDNIKIVTAGVGIDHIWSLTYPQYTIQCDIAIDLSNKHAALLINYIDGIQNRTRNLATISLAFANNIVENIVITYTPTKLTLRTTTTTITNDSGNQYFGGNHSPSQLVFHQPFNDQGTALREFAIYPVAAKNSEQVFFLNNY